MSHNQAKPADVLPSNENNPKMDATYQHATYKKPGRLKGEVHLTLHTAYAQKLFLGFRPDKRSINLLQFGGRMTQIWDASERDDPYADWYLLKVYDLLMKLQKQLSGEIKEYQAKLKEANQLANLTINPFESQQPVIESLWFRTQYGYMAASLIAHFDELMRTILTANRVGILLDKPEKDIRQFWLDELLALFRLPFKWKPLPVTRADFKSDNDQAKIAQEKMGQLPEPILLLTLRSPFAPAIKPITENKEEEAKANNKA